ncbi:MAG: SNF2 helicase associated domain-containing protein [Saprospiraceae bacterium]|nr:SNF2 helicase associated domain-containing protein [Saprospiraceae bacterium]
MFENHKTKAVFLFDIFENKWFADIEFEYEIFTINASAPGKRKTKLHFGDDGEIVVYECTRDFKKEDEVIDLLHSVGLTQYHNKRFFSSENTYAIFEKINEHQEFIGHHFDLQLPEIDGKLIQFNRWEVFPDFKLIHDWFDLKGVIRIGDDEFPFFVFFKNIRNDDRFFRLKNGHFAIIPEEIMTKYSQIAKFASEAAGKWKLSKSHYMLLDGADMKAHTSKIMDTEDNDFVVSPALKASLRPYQVDGVKWIVRHRKNGLGACLADDMGLGKHSKLLLLFWMPKTIK